MWCARVSSVFSRCPVIHLFTPLTLTCSDPDPVVSALLPFPRGHLFRVTLCGACLSHFLSLNSSHLSHHAFSWLEMSFLFGPDDTPFSRVSQFIHPLLKGFGLTFRFGQL